MSTATAIGLALGAAADALLGDPRRGHPVARFGAVAEALERAVYADRRLAGVAYVGTLVGGVVGITAALRRAVATRAVAEVALTTVATWAALGGTSLSHEAGRMRDLLAAGDVDGARTRLGHLCGRDPSSLGADDLARATVESLAENTSDAVVGPLVWGAVAGAPGILGYRALNTLDAMVGYRTTRYRRFGWAAARCDDLANLVPARLTAVLMALLAPRVGGTPRSAFGAWRDDAAGHPSPNAGPVEAAAAGALGVRLGGTTNRYGDHTDRRPAMGPDAPVTTRDVDRAIRLGRSVGVAALVVSVAVASRTGTGRSAR